MNYQDSVKGIQEFFKFNIIAQIPSTNIQWDNFEFKEPEDKSSWVRFSIRNSTNQILTLGSSHLCENSGMIFIQIFTNENTGTNEALILIDFIRDMFKNARISDIYLNTPKVRSIGVLNGWYQNNISIPYYFIDTINYNG